MGQFVNVVGFKKKEYIRPITQGNKFTKNVKWMITGKRIWIFQYITSKKRSVHFNRKPTRAVLHTQRPKVCCSWKVGLLNMQAVTWKPYTTTI